MVEITADIITEARRQLLLESLPATHRDLGASLDLAGLESFAGKVNEPMRLPATPDEIRENIGKRGWLDANRDRMGFR